MFREIIVSVWTAQKVILFVRCFVFAKTNLTQNTGYCPLLYTVCRKVAHATSASLLGVVLIMDLLLICFIQLITSVANHFKIVV